MLLTRVSPIKGIYFDEAVGLKHKYHIYRFVDLFVPVGGALGEGLGARKQSMDLWHLVLRFGLFTFSLSNLSICKSFCPCKGGGPWGGLRGE